MKEEKFEFLPEVNLICSEKTIIEEVVGDSPCPCCGFMTIPNKGDAQAYICPVCNWEIDLFIHGDDEPSDQNHGLTLNEARRKYRENGVVSNDKMKKGGKK